MSNKTKLQRGISFICVMTVVSVFIYIGHSHRQRQEEQQTADAAAQVNQQANLKATAAKAAQEAAKAAQEAADAHQRFVEKYVDTNIVKRAGNQMVAVAVASESGSMNHAIGVALIQHFKADHVQLTDSFFKPELITDGLFNNAFNGASALFNELELTKSLDALLLARQHVQYETNVNLDNVITANMSLEIATLPVTGQIQSQSWTLSANGSGFRPSEARLQAEERIIKQIEADKKMSLGL